MRKPGRPRKNGFQPMTMLVRVTLATFAYGRARDAGEKHSTAVREAVKYVRETAPSMRVSETEVKRIMAKWRSKRRSTCLYVSKPNVEPCIISVPGRDGRMIDARVVYTASVGPHPTYTRANAAAKDTKKKSHRD